MNSVQFHKNSYLELLVLAEDTQVVLWQPVSIHDDIGNDQSGWATSVWRHHDGDGAEHTSEAIVEESFWREIDGERKKNWDAGKKLVPYKNSHREKI